MQCLSRRSRLRITNALMMRRQRTMRSLGMRLSVVCPSQGMRSLARSPGVSLGWLFTYVPPFSFFSFHCLSKSATLSSECHCQLTLSQESSSLTSPRTSRKSDIIFNLQVARRNMRWIQTRGSSNWQKHTHRSLSHK